MQKLSFELILNHIASYFSTYRSALAPGTSAMASGTSTQAPGRSTLAPGSPHSSSSSEAEVQAEDEHLVSVSVINLEYVGA